MNSAICKQNILEPNKWPLRSAALESPQQELAEGIVQILGNK